MTLAAPSETLAGFPSETTGRAIAARVADGYVAALRQEQSPLLRSERAIQQRRERAQRIVLDVIAALAGDPAEPAAPDPWSVIHELRAHAIPATAAMRGTDLLFQCAFDLLAHALPCDPGNLAVALRRRLAADATALVEALSASNAYDAVTIEVLDDVVAAKYLSRQRAEVFRLIRAGADNSSIASTLGITEATVKAHVRAIGSIVGGRGKHGILRRARELGILVAIPLALLGTQLGDIATSISDAIAP